MPHGSGPPIASAYRAFHADTLIEVKPGEILTNSRGQPAKFVAAYPSRVSGKIVVDEASGTQREYYPRIFNLHEPIAEGDEPGRYPANDSVRLAVASGGTGTDLRLAKVLMTAPDGTTFQTEINVLAMLRYVERGYRVEVIGSSDLVVVADGED